jgi:hypothetical protein
MLKSSFLSLCLSYLYSICKENLLCSCNEGMTSGAIIKKIAASGYRGVTVLLPGWVISLEVLELSMQFFSLWAVASWLVSALSKDTIPLLTFLLQSQQHSSKVSKLQDHI